MMTFDAKVRYDQIKSGDIGRFAGSTKDDPFYWMATGPFAPDPLPRNHRRLLSDRIYGRFPIVSNEGTNGFCGYIESCADSETWVAD